MEVSERQFSFISAEDIRGIGCFFSCKMDYDIIEFDPDCDSGSEPRETDLVIPENMYGVHAILNKSNLFSIELWNSFTGKINFVVNFEK